MNYLVLKTIHIISVVAWFAGLFYVGRLFIYFKEAAAYEPKKKEILQDLLGVDKSRCEDFEPTLNKFSFVSPYWNPFTIIRWLGSRAIPARRGSGRAASAGYCFYETRSGYHFVSYDSFSKGKSSPLQFL